MRYGRFIVTERKDGRFTEECVSKLEEETGCAPGVSYIKTWRLFSEVLDSLLGFVREHRRPGDPDEWETLMGLFPQDRKKLESIMLERCKNALLGTEEKGPYDAGELPF